jgi:hypothetical protein
MTNTFDKETNMFLVDFENNTIINYGKSEEMVTQMDQSHGNLFVVDYDNLTEHMKIQYAFSDMLEEAYKEEEDK